MESYHCPVQNPPMALRLETKPKSPQWPVGLVCSNLCCLSHLISYSSVPSACSIPAFSWILAVLRFLKHTQETPARSLCTHCSLCLVRFSPATHGSLSRSTEVSAQMPLHQRGLLIENSTRAEPSSVLCIAPSPTPDPVPGT